MIFLRSKFWSFKLKVRTRSNTFWPQSGGIYHLSKRQKCLSLFCMWFCNACFVFSPHSSEHSTRPVTWTLILASKSGDKRKKKNLSKISACYRSLPLFIKVVSEPDAALFRKNREAIWRSVSWQFSNSA